MSPVRLRPASDADFDFQRRLYHDVRAQEMAHFPFTADEATRFLDWQFQCQWDHYRGHYPTCEWRIIEDAGEAIGRLLVDRWPDQIRIVDIAIHSSRCGRGLGTALMKNLLEEGRAAGKPVTIHVEVFNPARRLYGRLGFEEIATSGAYILMRWSPVPVPAPERVSQVNTAS
jgi:ribosomal protein S18 acetylase RimI-like enzyme